MPPVQWRRLLHDRRNLSKVRDCFMKLSSWFAQVNTLIKLWNFKKGYYYYNEHTQGKFDVHGREVLKNRCSCRFHLCARFVSSQHRRRPCNGSCGLGHRLTGSRAPASVARLLRNVGINVMDYTERDLLTMFRRRVSWNPPGWLSARKTQGFGFFFLEMSDLKNRHAHANCKRNLHFIRGMWYVVLFSFLIKAVISNQF